jgi:uncharacterized protein
MHGQFVWYELMTSDAAAALRFYPAVTGWGTDEFDKMQYTMWTANSVPLGGVMQLRPEQLGNTPSHWLPYIAVNDVDAAAKQVTSLGGALHHGPIDIPGTGRAAIMTDPQGAFFAIYKSVEDSPGFDGTRKPGHFVWHELMTSDMNAAYEFYRKMFGWEKTSAFDMGPDVGMYQMYGQRGAEYGGIFNASGRMAGMPPFWTCYVHVKDVKKAAAVATKLGGQLVNGPMEVPGGDIIAVVMDPQGAAFALHQNPIAAPARMADKKVLKTAAKKAGRKAKTSARKVKKVAKRVAKKAAKRVGKAARKALRRVRKPARRTAKKAAKRATRSRTRAKTRRKGRRR